MKKMKSAPLKLIFDGDGTLYDSGHGIKTSANYTLSSLGYPTFPLEDMDFFVGPPLIDCFRLAKVREEDLPEAMDIYRRHQNEVTKFDLVLYPHVKKTLEKLKNSGNLIYLGTSRKQSLACELLRHLSIDSLFDGIFGADEDGSRASKEEVLQKVISESPSVDDVYMVGDTKFDILGGKHHHMKTIAVSYGYGDKEELKESRPDFLIDDFAKIPEILK